VTLHACLLSGRAAMPVDLRERRRPKIPSVGHDVALVMHTSGTTGEPQPVELTYGQILAQARGTAEALAVTDDERWLCPLPLSHVGGLMVLLRSVIYATTAVIGPPDRDDVTLASMVPTQLARLREPPPGLRAVLLGGAAPGALKPGWPVARTYGLTQACSSVTIGEIGDVHTSGRPIPGVEVTIAPDGEIVVDGPTTNGTLHTGDLGRLDDHGRLIVIGRKSDTIVSGGENVAPMEVEAALLEHPAVADAGVFARPHPEWGEAVTARVVLQAPATEAELREFVGERLARFKVPKAIEVADTLPRTASGKLLRRELT
jgi:O-succinylbenzoic acid--CoA ligase